MPQDLPDVMYGGDLLNQARTLRECVFARMVSNATIDRAWEVPVLALRVPLLGSQETLRIPWDTLVLADILTLVEASEHKERFAAIPFTGPSVQVNGNPELQTCLQELAELVAYECSEAYRATYYPRPVSVEAMSTAHVHEVMEAMTREQEREGTRRKKTWAVFTDLPQERQQSLAERRRFWFGEFGITPASWKTGTFSLWDVADIPVPDCIGGKAVVR